MPSVKLASQQDQTAVMQQQALMKEERERGLTKLLQLQNSSSASACRIFNKKTITTTKHTMKKTGAFYRRLECFRKSRDYSFLTVDDDGHEETCSIIEGGASGLQAAKTVKAPASKTPTHKRPPALSNAKALVNPKPPQCTSSSCFSSSTPKAPPSSQPAMVACNKTLKSSARPSNYHEGTPACLSHGKTSGTKRRAEAKEAGKGKLVRYRSKGLELIDDEEDGEAASAAMIRSTIWKMFNYNPTKRAAQEEDGRTDDRGMVSNFGDIQREEKRSAKIAQEEDRREQELLKMEERQDKAKQASCQEAGSLLKMEERQDKAKQASCQEAEAILN